MQNQVKLMLERLNYRGLDGSKVVEHHNATLGAVWPAVQSAPTSPTLQGQAVWDGMRPPLPEPRAMRQHTEPFALAASTLDGLFLARDPHKVVKRGDKLHLRVLRVDALCQRVGLSLTRVEGWEREAWKRHHTAPVNALDL